MSYSRAIQPLVIEDEQRAKKYYESVFRSLGKKYTILPPKFAFCLEDAVELLAQDIPYHLVVLDLCLPETPRQPPAQSIDFGLGILKSAVNRESFPIPTLLVISGNLQHARQQDLTQRVENGFSHGRVLVKSDMLEHEIEDAIKHCEQYCDVGIHLRDSGDSVFPTISPRDEDLLRRCALERNSVALDLEWWSAELDQEAWTKVLLGRFTSEGGKGQSLYSFFKLATSQGATSVLHEAQILEQKLKHVNVLFASASGSRSLLVTQAIGQSDERPLTLKVLLSKPHLESRDALRTTAAKVAGQVASLGGRSPDECEVSQLLWNHHDLDRLKGEWERRGGDRALSSLMNANVDCPNPIEIYSVLKSSTVIIRYKRQECRHGDLNVSNIALEKSPLGTYNAYIFDASGCSAGSSVRDLAMLEVTTLLHQPSASISFVRRCMALYFRAEYGPSLNEPDLDDQSANIFTFINCIRDYASRMDEMRTYALLVFDNAMMQLGGLGFGSTFNKICDPTDAVFLAALSARWLKDLASDLFAK